MMPSSPLRTLLCLFFGLTLAGCIGPSNRGDDDDSASDDDDAPAWPVPLYDGTCPQFTDGLNEDFLSSGNNRQFRLALPDNPDGAPVIFAWHWLGGSAQQAMDWLEFGELPQSENVIVVAPESDGYPSEWRFDQESDNNPDATLFEDILACLVEQWDVDLGRVHTTGMSAGGLWSTWMILNRSEWLASAAPMSGGVLSNYYTSPTDPIPVMLIWGGPTDVYGSFSFDLASKDFSEDLQGDGHFVVECDHGSGHVPPDSPATLAWDFFSEHPKAEDSPWEAGLPTHLPSFCSLA
jgi:dienelactone hydrolase